jgi:hypothetical protein
MAHPVESVIRETLRKQQRGVRLRAAMTGAWQTLKDDFPDRAWWRRKSTRAAIVWEEAVNNAIASFSDDKGINPVRHFDTVSFVVDDAVLIRLKKVDMELRSSNVQTVLSSMFHRHDADLFGYSGLQRVEAAYVLNKFETDMAWVGIVAREKKTNLFHFEFSELGAAAGSLLTFPETTKSSPEDIAKIRRILPEQQTRDEKGE